MSGVCVSRMRAMGCPREDATLVSGERRGKALKYHLPAALGAGRIVGQHALVDQDELAAAARGRDLDGDPRELGGEFRHGEAEREAARPIDLEVFADMLDVLAVAPVHAGEAPADARIA